MSLAQRKKLMEERKKIEERRNRLKKKPLILSRISKAEREKLARHELARLKGEKKAKRVREKFEEGKRTGNRTLKFLQKGNEAKTITKYKTMAGENVVLKSYKIGKKGQWLKNANEEQKLAQELYEKGEAIQSGIITEKGRKGRFAFQKEAFKRGLAVSEPIIIKKKEIKLFGKKEKSEEKILKNIMRAQGIIMK